MAKPTQPEITRKNPVIEKVYADERTPSPKTPEKATPTAITEIYGDDKPEAKAPQPQAQERQPAPTEAPQADTGQTDDSGDSDIRSFMNERNMVRTYPDAILSGHPTIPLRNSEVVRRTQRGGLIPSDFPLVRDAQNAAEIVQMDIPDNERTWSDEIAMGLTILGQRSLRAWQELTDSGKDRADLLVPAQTEGAISEFVANDLLRFSGLAVGGAAMLLGAPAVASAALGVGSGFAGLYLLNLINTFNVDDEGITNLKESTDNVFINMFGLDDEEKFDGYDPERFLRSLQLTINMAAEDFIVGAAFSRGGALLRALSKSKHLASERGAVSIGRKAATRVTSSAAGAATETAATAATAAADGLPSFKPRVQADDFFDISESSTVMTKTADVARSLVQARLFREASGIKRIIDVYDETMEGITDRLRARGATGTSRFAKNLNVKDSEQVRRAAVEAGFGSSMDDFLADPSEATLNAALESGVFYSDSLRKSGVLRRVDDEIKHAKSTKKTKAKPYKDTIGIGGAATGSSIQADVLAYDRAIRTLSKLRKEGAPKEILEGTEDLIEMMNQQMLMKNTRRGGDLYEIKNTQRITKELLELRSREAAARATIASGDNRLFNWYTKRAADQYKSRADEIVNAISNPNYVPEGWQERMGSYGSILERLVGQSLYENMLAGGALVKSVKAFLATGLYDNAIRNARLGGGAQFMFEINQSREFLTETARALASPKGRSALAAKYGSYFTDGKLNLEYASVLTGQGVGAATKFKYLNMVLGFNTGALSAFDEFGGQLYHAGIMHNAVNKVVREEILQSGGAIATREEAVKHIDKILGNPKKISPRMLEKLEKAVHLNHNELAFRAAKNASEVESVLAKLGWTFAALTDTAIPYSSLKAVIAPFSRVNANVLDFVSDNTVIGALGVRNGRFGAKVTKKQLKGTAAAYMFFLAADGTMDLTVSDVDQSFKTRGFGSYNTISLAGKDIEISALGGLGEAFLKLRSAWDVGQMFYENPEDEPRYLVLAKGIVEYMTTVSAHPILDQRNIELLLGGPVMGPKSTDLMAKYMGIKLAQAVPGGATVGRVSQALRGKRAANRNPWGATHEIIHDFMKDIDPEIYDSLRESIPDWAVPEASTPMFDHFGVQHESGERPVFAKFADTEDKKSHVTVFLNPNSRGGDATKRRKVYKYLLGTRAFAQREGAARIGDEFYDASEFMWNRVPPELNKRVAMPKTSISLQNRRVRLNANEMMIRNSLISGDIDVIINYLKDQKRRIAFAKIDHEGGGVELMGHLEGINQQLNLNLAQAMNMKKQRQQSKGDRTTIDTLHRMVTMADYNPPGAKEIAKAYKNELKAVHNIEVSDKDARELVRRNHVVSVYNGAVAMANELIKLSPSVQLRAFHDIDGSLAERL